MMTNICWLQWSYVKYTVHDNTVYKISYDSPVKIPFIIGTDLKPSSLFKIICQNRLIHVCAICYSCCHVCILNLSIIHGKEEWFLNTVVTKFCKVVYMVAMTTGSFWLNMYKLPLSFPSFLYHHQNFHYNRKRKLCITTVITILESHILVNYLLISTLSPLQSRLCSCVYSLVEH